MFVNFNEYLEKTRGFKEFQTILKHCFGEFYYDFKNKKKNLRFFLFYEH